MSIYSKGFDFKYGLGKAKTTAIAGIIILFVVFVAFTLYNLFSQTPLEIRFEQNPWKQPELSSNLLFVKVSNVTGKDVKLTRLDIKPRAFNSLIIYPKTAEISETLAPNDSRVLTFDIRRVFSNQNLPAGKYTIDFKVSFDGWEYSAETVLNIE